MLVVDQVLAGIDLKIEGLGVEEPPILAKNLCYPIPQDQSEEACQTGPNSHPFFEESKSDPPNVSLKDRIYSPAKYDTSTITFDSSIYSSP